MLETVTSNPNTEYINMTKIAVTFVVTACVCMKASHSHFSEVLGHSDGSFVEGVASGRAVGVDRPDSFGCDYFVVCGVACSILDYIELKTQSPHSENFLQRAYTVYVNEPL